MIWAAISDRIARRWTLLDFTEIGGQGFQIYALVLIRMRDIREDKDQEGPHIGDTNDLEFV